MNVFIHHKSPVSLRYWWTWVGLSPEAWWMPSSLAVNCFRKSTWKCWSSWTGWYNFWNLRSLLVSKWLQPLIILYNVREDTRVTTKIGLAFYLWFESFMLRRRLKEVLVSVLCDKHSYSVPALRMELLDGDANGDLIQTLSGILMIMPQTNAFKLFRDRLACLPTLQRWDPILN